MALSSSTLSPRQILDALAQQTIWVVGDLMLDLYVWGEVERISPEAPVPVLNYLRQEARVGGAANVALNLAALGCKTRLMGVVGDDAHGLQLRQMLEQQGIDCSGVLACAGRPTTTKTRIIARNQQMLRIDEEVTTHINQATAQTLTEWMAVNLNNARPDALIFEDYEKGLLFPEVIGTWVNMANEAEVITAVDPKFRNFWAYEKVTLFKPNLKEVERALQLPHGEALTTEKLAEIHARLQERLHHQTTLLTLSEHGVFVQQEGGAQAWLPAHQRQIADVSGAGDTVIAVATAALAATGDVVLAAELANLSGGLVCEEVGTAAIRVERLEKEMGEGLTSIGH